MEKKPKRFDYFPSL